MRRRFWLATIGFGALLACSKPNQDNEAKVWPAPPPTPKEQLGKDISITVMVDGAAKAPITDELLRATKPDFVDEDRKAWRVSTLVGGTIGEVEASGPNGIAVKFPAPTAELEPVLFLTRRGDVLVQAVDPKEPFPGHHGQGGRLHRPGDSLPRVEKVAKLEIKRSTP